MQIHTLISCEIKKMSHDYYILISDRPIEPGQLIWYDTGHTAIAPQGYTNPIRCKKVEATRGSMNIKNPHTIPEHIIEAFTHGITKFNMTLIEKSKTITTFELGYTTQGLLDITYEKPKKQTFTREEVLEILTTLTLEKNINRTEQWLDQNFK